ncbi:hypothetical protein SAMN02799622_05126 [Methylobacterium sp. UNC378MF]|uniref:hypothetical protein n=1 Tax=Methylobacterium sp. UNC378MF TaxID=1502748 RepID=UPI000881B96E|nr:hypothetical protein [Methylobacterium sp. UNC378MF]SDA31937.1 hypothetical protein SAMN02799622_05126 [Methylobacterium sp. UNC378MF]
MRTGRVPTRAALLPVALLLAIPAEARQHDGKHPGKPHHRTASDMDRTLARRAARDRPHWRVWQQTRPLVRALAPATRERVGAPPFTGWGYGGTIPGAWPGF